MNPIDLIPDLVPWVVMAALFILFFRQTGGGSGAGELLDLQRKNRELAERVDQLQKQIEELKFSHALQIEWYESMIVKIVSRNNYSDVNSPDTMKLHTKQGSRLLDLISKHFNMVELKRVMFDAGIPDGEIPGETIQDMAREVILYAYRTKAMPALVRELRRMRPQVEWPVIT